MADLITILRSQYDGDIKAARESGAAEVRGRVEALHQRVPADSPFNREGRDVCGACMDGIHPADWPCDSDV